ncbi:hypothetical protein [Azospirillum picis]|uniref:UDP-N-acetylmuramyl pentapeptide synthase n=1 Tax=Azospirillum picis TaxID=488438 RepID=A0ABU0MTV0_9PROT|nr:hypothetical protein [Azospirillum picis]MBP2303169.1 UDP-N-acetylmuramyl pentapeptide synthase [Azospirillum picis]MDQ0536921.1 UDP-N-acetylmuramyl pentapeptide synthase [Azospirillum picis]
MKPVPSSIMVDEAGPQKFTLTVMFDGQRFDCGSYISRAAAMQAGRLFVQRKEGEAAGGRTKRKPGKR